MEGFLLETENVDLGVISMDLGATRRNPVESHHATNTP